MLTFVLRWNTWVLAAHSGRPLYAVPTAAWLPAAGRQVDLILGLHHPALVRPSPRAPFSGLPVSCSHPGPHLPLTLLLLRVPEPGSGRRTSWPFRSPWGTTTCPLRGRWPLLKLRPFGFSRFRVWSRDLARRARSAAVPAQAGVPVPRVCSPVCGVSRELGLWVFVPLSRLSAVLRCGQRECQAPALVQAAVSSSSVPLCLGHVVHHETPFFGDELFHWWFFGVSGNWPLSSPL